MQSAKRPFDVDVAMPLIEEAVRPYPPAALFELAEEGHRSAFEQLVACIISIRTRDEMMITIARSLFAQAPTPAAIAALPLDDLDLLIGQSSFHASKARQIQSIARLVDRDHGGVLPCDRDLLLSFPGVGPKCANLVLGIACNQPRVGVDAHVHRITNRWGYVSTQTPEATMDALEATLPRRYWVEINRLLVPFGKHVCIGTVPRCSTCPVLDMCQQRGVGVRR